MSTCNERPRPTTPEPPLPPGQSWRDARRRALESLELAEAERQAERAAEMQGGLVCGSCLAPYPGHAEDCPTQRFTPAEGMRALHPDTVTLREELADLKRRVAALEERR